MIIREADNTEKIRKEKAKQAIALAMQNRWAAAVATNLSILNEFPEDVEAYNRLGKALSELGRIREATAAFHLALNISPYNTIAKKNLERLTRLGDDASGAANKSTVTPRVFIEESGKSGVTSLLNLAPTNVLLKLAPGHPVALDVSGNGLRVTDADGEQVGQVEPRLASRLIRLMAGGNRYEAAVTSVGEQGLTIIVREVHQDPSQTGVVSFPSRGGGDHRVYLPSAFLGNEIAEEEKEVSEPAAVKDWSDDDTEPGDDDAFTPVLHRIISAGDEAAEGED